ncbi:MAG: DUF2391 family protein [Desulfurobacteriaceae bacterium]
MDRELERELKKIEEKLEHIDGILCGEKKGFSFSDFIQEVAGAVILAFPFAANADIWEISRKMSPIHSLLLLTIIIGGLFTTVKYGKLGNWKVQEIAGFIPVRVFTVLTISLLVSALSLLILGIYPAIIDSTDWFLKTVILVTLFSVIGSLGLDAAK